MNITLVVVVWYVRDFEELLSLIDNFEKASGLTSKSVVVVDNYGDLFCVPLQDSRFSIIRGSNLKWEFSGYAEGLARIEESKDPNDVIGCINDSYHKNWDFYWFTSFMLKRYLMKLNIDGGVLLPLDIFRHGSFTQCPIRTVNSRMFFVTSGVAKLFQGFLESLLVKSESDLIDSLSRKYRAYEKTVDKWINRSASRWDDSAVTSVKSRIVLEHSLIFFEHCGASSVRSLYFPSFIAESYAFSFVGKIFKERR